MRIIFHPSLYADLAYAIDYYIKNAGQKLADELTEDFDSVIETIAERPESFAIMKHHIRRANLSRFPYNILFYRKANSVKNNGASARPTSSVLWKRAKIITSNICGLINLH